MQIVLNTTLEIEGDPEKVINSAWSWAVTKVIDPAFGCSRLEFRKCSGVSVMSVEYEEPTNSEAFVIDQEDDRSSLNK
jgi:hypothetical protein